MAKLDLVEEGDKLVVKEMGQVCCCWAVATSP